VFLSFFSWFSGSNLYPSALCKVTAADMETVLVFLIVLCVCVCVCHSRDTCFVFILYKIYLLPPLHSLIHVTCILLGIFPNMIPCRFFPQTNNLFCNLHTMDDQLLKSAWYLVLAVYTCLLIILNYIIKKSYHMWFFFKSISAEAITKPNTPLKSIHKHSQLQSKTRLNKHSDIYRNLTPYCMVIH